MKTKKVLVVVLSLMITAAGSVAQACGASDESLRGSNVKTSALLQTKGTVASVDAQGNISTHR